MIDNVFYFRHINSLGGVESFLYYLSKLFKNFVVYYEKGDPIQVERLSKNVEIHKHNKEHVRCKRFFGNYGLDNFLPYLEADEKYFVIHCDYKKNKLCKPIVYPGFKYIAVSKLAGESFKEMTGLDYELIYNPIVLDNPHVEKKKGLHIVAGTRLSGEKGGWRIDKLSEILDKANVDYDLTIYTNKPKRLKFQSKNVIIKPPKLDLTKEMQEATWVLQLSDHEAFGLSVAESLVLGTPVLITNIPAFHEIGCNESNSLMFSLDMTDVDIEKIKKGLPPFKYSPPKSNWGKYLDNNREYNPEEIIEVKVLKNYTDIVLGKKLLRYKDTLKKEKMTRVRASFLEAKGLVEL